jgi:antibiotic biosynthesis monooxygenase (ABM) superfamily enzyme
MRIDQEEYQEWNMMIANLAQLSCGYISTNVRRLALRSENNDWIVEVILEKDDQEDRQNMNEVVEELISLSEGNSEGMVYSRFIVDDGPQSGFPGFQEFERSIFLRKEY